MIRVRLKKFEKNFPVSRKTGLKLLIFHLNSSKKSERACLFKLNLGRLQQLVYA